MYSSMLKIDWLAVAYAEEDNAIDFNDTTVSLISIGMLHRF
jgi:hypothetical protein